MADVPGGFPLYVESFTAEAAMSANWAVSVSHTTVGTVKVAAAGEQIIGFVKESVAAGAIVDVIMMGVVEAIAGADIARTTSDEPTLVEAAGTGKVKACGTATGVHYCCGYVHPSQASISSGSKVAIVLAPIEKYIA